VEETTRRDRGEPDRIAVDTRLRSTASLFSLTTASSFVFCRTGLAVTLGLSLSGDSHGLASRRR